MNRDQRNIVIEYAANLSEEDLRWVALRLMEKLSGDLPEALNFLASYAEMDTVLQSANTAWEFYDLCDKVREVFFKEAKKRGLVLQWGPKVA